MQKTTYDLACASSQLAKLHNSLDDEGKERLNDSLKLAEKTTQQRCAELICGLCASARLGRVSRAQRDDGRWLHRDKGDFFTCAAGAIFEAIKRSEE